MKVIMKCVNINFGIYWAVFITYWTPLVCARAVKALARRYECSGASEHWLMKYALCTPILRMCESSEGSGKTAWILSLDWVLTERNMPYVRPFCACARAVKALARLHACSGESEHWLMEYAVCMPILCMCKRSDGSGETARMLRLVWAWTDKTCHVYTHCVYVREQWRL